MVRLYLLIEVDRNREEEAQVGDMSSKRKLLGLKKPPFTTDECVNENEQC